MNVLNSFCIKIGNVVAAVQSTHSYVQTICNDYLTDDRPNCEIIITKDVINHEYNDISQAMTLGETPIAPLKDSFIEVYALLHKMLRILPLYNMLFIHGSAIQYNGKAYIFVATSGTGKSTHTRLWKERFGDDVTVINDDKPFLLFQNGKVILCGTPWRGKHNIGANIEAELAGICILSRGEIDSISPIEASEAVREIIQQCNLHRYKENALLALDLIDELLRQVPGYSLSCTPTQNAVDVCFNTIIK